jgi:hypothetical protein
MEKPPIFKKFPVKDSKNATVEIDFDVLKEN